MDDNNPLEGDGEATAPEVPEPREKREKPKVESLYYNISEAAIRAHYSPSYIRRLCEQGRIVGNQPGGRKWLISKAEFDTLIAKGKIPPRPKVKEPEKELEALKPVEKPKVKRRPLGFPLLFREEEE